MLERLRTQAYIEFRDHLIRHTHSARPSITEVYLCIGVWTVMTRDAKLRLDYRLPPSSDVVLPYSANLERHANDWLAGPLVLGHAHRR